LLLLAVAAAAPSPAWAGWGLPAANISPSGEDAGFSDVEIGSNGAIFAVWVRDDGTSNVCCSRIQIRIRPPGEPHFGDARNLSPAGQNAGSPQISVGPDSTVGVIWLRNDGTQQFCCDRVQSKVRPPGSSFGSVQTLSAGGQNANDPEIGVARGGRAVATWTRAQSPTIQRVLQGRFRPAGGGSSPNFGGVRTLTPGDNAYSSDLEVAPNGRAIVIFQRFGGATNRISAMVRPPGQEFGPRTNLSRVGDDADYPVLGIGPDGSALAVWLIGSGPEYTLQARFRPSNGPFGSVQRVSTNANSDDAAISVASDRTATVAWDQVLDPDPARVRVRTRSPGAGFGPGQFISPPTGGAGDPHLATTPGGTTFAVWRRSDGTSGICCQRVQARMRRPGGSSFVMQKTLSLGGFSATNLALDAGPHGAAATTWQRFDGQDTRIQFARYAP
jgi:hypothetical protein